MSKKNSQVFPPNEIIFYETEDGKISIAVRFENENVWLTQKHMAELFGCSVDNISLHLKNIYATGELNEKATTEESSIVQQEGKRYVKRMVLFYNLEAVIAVGYRVNSERGIAFRAWATVQNKLHFAIAGNTAAEIIADRASASKPNMGLTSWRKAPDGKIFLSDVRIAKNYLSKDEISQLNRIVNMYIDYAEFQAARGKVMIINLINGIIYGLCKNFKRYNRPFICRI